MTLMSCMISILARVGEDMCRSENVCQMRSGILAPKFKTAHVAIRPCDTKTTLRKKCRDQNDENCGTKISAPKKSGKGNELCSYLSLAARFVSGTFGAILRGWVPDPKCHDSRAVTFFETSSIPIKSLKIIIKIQLSF